MVNLIRAPFWGDEFVVPLGLVSLASAVEHSHGAVITDLCLHLEQGEITLSEEGYRKAARIILAKGKRVLGFSSMCNSYPAAICIARECKELAPDSVIIFGGPQASVVHTATLEGFPFIDIVVRGEGEHTLPELLTALARGEPLDAIMGITYRKGTEVVATMGRPTIGDLDALPFPNFRLVPELERYFAAQEVKEAAIEAGRGCPYACTFCSTSEFFSRRYRMKSPDRIRAEMRWFAENLGVTNFTLHHDNFNAATPKVLEFCQVMEDAGASYTWRCSSRTDNITAELAERMARAGCRSIFFGVESGSPAVQRQMNKRLDVSTARSMVAATLQNGITPTCSFIVGFPEETESDLNMTLTLALECRLLGTPSIQLHPMSPLPGTPLTLSNQYPLQFRPEAVRVHDASPAGAVSPAEIDMILSYPRIFSSFYLIVPVHLSVDLVYLSSSTLMPLIWHVPLSLYWYTRAAQVELTEVARRLGAHLPGGTLSWTPEALFGALGELVDAVALPWLSDLLQWETCCYTLKQAPPVRPAVHVRSLTPGPLQWAPGTALLETRYRLDTVMVPPDVFAPQPLPQPAAAVTAYLLVRDGMTVRTLGLAPAIVRAVNEYVAAPTGQPEPDLREMLFSLQKAGILQAPRRVKADSQSARIRSGKLA
ncbi:MAG TPA: radical SAM protein [Symbiobacteriaceae bacterium]|nr:radical SAM protein [Symbiobacteriaceae bacterium]